MIALGSGLNVDLYMRSKCCFERVLGTGSTGAGTACPRCWHRWLCVGRSPGVGAAIHRIRVPAPDSACHAVLDAAAGPPTVWRLAWSEQLGEGALDVSQRSPE